ncbi:iron chaperone [Atopococcus tabaci]|uniref:iron chaperone n=1 Tax=Atopococcus tabaci TaxID=269774 RepID=UPI0003F55AAE|nr:iron chaperone [Atopococcus tabaci]
MDAFNEFLSGIDHPEQRQRTEEVLTWVKDTFPNLVPVVKWNQPLFTEHDTYIIGFSVSKKHLAVAPEQAGIHHFEEEIQLAGYDYTKELIRMSWDKPVNYPLLQKIIEFNIQDKADATTFWRK